MSQLRILVLASSCDPSGTSVPYVAYCHAAALGELHEVTLVIGSSAEDKVRRANGPFSAVEVVQMRLLDRVYAWAFRWIFRSNFSSQALTAFGYPFYLAFEWYAWRQLRRRINAGEFDVVLRLLPISAVNSGPFAFLLQRGSIPFVVGPINGGLPWPSGFSQIENQKEWISSLRNCYRYLPFTRFTYRHASAIIAASSQTWAEFSEYSDKLFFIPENGISSSTCSNYRRASQEHERLELVFVGGLVPCKACDLALRAVAPLLRNGLARFTILGDGPEREKLEQLVRSLGIEEGVAFHGWVSHGEVLRRLQSSDVMVFPSVRDFGGGVVFEALAAGAVPIVVDFGGPGDIVRPEVGYKVPLTNEGEIVSQLGEILTGLAQDRDLLSQLRRQGMAYAQEHLTWEAKARSTTEVLNWAVGRGPRPDLPPPKILYSIG